MTGRISARCLGESDGGRSLSCPRPPENRYEGLQVRHSLHMTELTPTPITADTPKELPVPAQVVTAQDRDLAFRRKLDVARTAFDIVKACTVAAAAIAVFLLLQRPE